MNGVWVVAEYNEDEDIIEYTLYSTREKAIKAAKEVIDYSDCYDDDDEREALYLQLETTECIPYVVAIECKMIH